MEVGMSLPVTNEYANALLARLREDLDGNFQELMDAMSGLSNYRPWEVDRQGKVGSIIGRIARGSGGRDEFQELVAIFWQAVIASIPKAAAYGGSVDAADGTRDTRMNPVYWLRQQGIFAVRRAVTSNIRASIRRVCTTCQTSWAASVTECGACGSGELEVSARRADIDLGLLEDGARPLEQEALGRIDARRAIDAISRQLPRHPVDPTIETAAQRVWRALTEPEVGAEVCRTCRDKTPEDYCGAESFEFGLCNFSAKLGLWMGCSSTLAARRINTIRKVALRVLSDARP